MKVSVIIPLYNKARYIERALKSVIDQTFRDFEIIIVDDGSTDSGDRIVQAVTDPRIRLIKQPNSGVSSARNTGIKEARSEWIAFLDADDTWMPDKLEKQYNSLSAQQDIVWSAHGFIWTINGQTYLKKESFLPGWFESGQIIKDALVPLSNGRHLCIITIMIRRDILLKTGGFDESLVTGEDLDLFFRIALQHPRLIYLNQSLAEYDVWVEHSLTKTHSSRYDEESICRLARRFLSADVGNDPDRRKIVEKYAKHLVLSRLNNALKTGEGDLVKRVLRNLDWIDLGLSGRIMKTKALIPPFIYNALRRIFRSKNKKRNAQ